MHRTRIPEPKHCPHVRVAIVIFWSNISGFCQVLLTKRADHAHLGGLWEFPGGKLEPGESSIQAAVREVREEIGWEIAPPNHLAVHTHRYQDRIVELHCFISEVSTLREPYGLRKSQWRWHAITQLAQLELPAANQGVIRRAIEWIEQRDRRA